MPAEVTPLKRKRGRPAKFSRWLSLADVARIVRTDEDTLERVLAGAPGVLPGAVCDAEGWRVPEAALRELLGVQSGPLPTTATPAEVARYTRRDRKTVYGWLKMRRPNGEPLLPYREILGSIIIDVRDVLALPGRMPGPPPSFFANSKGGSEHG